MQHFLILKAANIELEPFWSMKIQSTKTHTDFYHTGPIKQADEIDQDQTARSVQSDLDLFRPQRLLVSPVALIGRT